MMSYDLMVFEPLIAPKERHEFMAWYRLQTKWGEDHNYQDHAVSSHNLQAWLLEMTKSFPAMNGPLASYDINVDGEDITDYSIGKSIILASFSWSVVEEAHTKMRSLAIKHKVGFFDVSASNGEILFP